MKPAQNRNLMHKGGCGFKAIQKLNLIKAENALRISKVVLDNAMGMPNTPK